MCPRFLYIKNYLRLPTGVDLLHGDLVIRDGFDLGIDRVTGLIEGLAVNRGFQARRLQHGKRRITTEKTLRIVHIQQFAEPLYEQVLTVNGVEGDREAVPRLNPSTFNVPSSR